MKTWVGVWRVLWMVGWVLAVGGPGAWAQEGAAGVDTKTIVGDLLMIDRDLYVVRGERGEIQIEATYKTEVTEDFQFGDRIKALVLKNNRALKIERAGPGDVPGVVDNQPVVAVDSAARDAGRDTAVAASAAVVPKQPAGKTIVGDLLMIDRDLYVVRGERGEIQIEATPQTEMTEAFQFGDRIKAFVLMNNKAVKIERAGPGDEPGVTVYRAAATRAVRSDADAQDKPAAVTNGDDRASVAPPSAVRHDTKVVEGQVLMVDGDFYVIRGGQGEIRVERTPTTTMAEEFKFGDFIRAMVTPTDRALSIERLPSQ